MKQFRNLLHTVFPNRFSSPIDTGAEESVFPAPGTPIESEPVLAFKTLDQLERFLDAGTNGQSKAFFDKFDQSVIAQNDTLVNAINRREELNALVNEVDLVINDTERRLNELVLLRSNLP